MTFKPARYNVRDIAEYVLDFCNFRMWNSEKIDENIHYLNNTHLNYALYFIQAEFLVTQHRPCFNARIEAWDFGAIILDIYMKYRGYGAGLIPRSILRYTNPSDLFYSKEDQMLVENMASEVMKYPRHMLLDTIRQQTPWLKAYQPLPMYHQSEMDERLYRRSVTITNESIYDFFKE